MMRELRRTASLRASCKPLRNDSAVVRTYELCIHVLKPGVAIVNRMENTAIETNSSTMVTPACEERRVLTVHKRKGIFDTDALRVFIPTSTRRALLPSRMQSIVIMLLASITALMSSDVRATLVCET